MAKKYYGVPQARIDAAREQGRDMVGGCGTTFGRLDALQRHLDANKDSAETQTSPVKPPMRHPVGASKRAPAKTKSSLAKPTKSCIGDAHGFWQIGHILDPPKRGEGKARFELTRRWAKAAQ